MPENEYDQTYYEGELNPSYVTASPTTKKGKRKLKQARGRAQVAQAIQTYMTDSKLPKSVLSERARNGDPNAYLSLTAQGRDEDMKRVLRFGAGMLGTGALAALGAAAVPVVEGIAAGTSTIPVVLGNAGRMLGNGLGKVGEYISPVFNNPVAKFYFSRPVQGAISAGEAAQMGYNWARTGERPSTSNIIKWGVGTALGVGLGGNWGEASKAAYEIPGYLKGMVQTGADLGKEIGNGITQGAIKGYSRVNPKQVLKWTTEGSETALKEEINNYLHGVSSRDQKWFDKTFTTEKLEDLKQANIDNFKMRLRASAPEEVKEYFNQNPGSFDKIANSYTKRFNFQVVPMSRYQKWSSPGTLGITSAYNMRNPMNIYFGEEQFYSPGVFVRGNQPIKRAYNTAMHEYHHAADRVAWEMNHAGTDLSLTLFPNKTGNIRKPVYYYDPGAYFSNLPHTYNPSSNLFNKLNKTGHNHIYSYSGNGYVNSPGEVRARMSGYAYTHSTPENQLYSKPFSEWGKKDQRGFVISDRLYDPFNFPMNYRKIGDQIKALEEHPGVFNRKGGKLIKRK